MKTDELSAKEYAKTTRIKINGVEFLSAKINYVLKKSFLAGCQHIRTTELAESENKAMRFAEWTHMVKGLVWSAYRKAWVYTTATTVREYTTAELFTSPEFLAYYEERRGE